MIQLLIDDHFLTRNFSQGLQFFWMTKNKLNFPDSSHKNSKFFKIDRESGKITFDSKDRIFGAKPVKVIACDGGEPQLNNSDPFQVNVYFMAPGENINSTVALAKFETEEESWLTATMGDYGLYIIAAIIAIAIIAIIIIVVIIIK